MNQVTNSNKLYFNILKIPHILNFIDCYFLNYKFERNIISSSQLSEESD